MIIILLTDFGTKDTYVGVMKGVIKGIAPDVDIIDLTHHIPPQDIAAAGDALASAYRYFPPGTVHLAVVDPGVGTSRRAVAARVGACVYVCPDNGLLSPLLAQETVHEAVILDNSQFHRHPVSRTFQGRDVFAPAAAHLARGVPLGSLGTPLDTLTTYPLSAPHVVGDTLTCHAVSVDTFGNVITDLSEDTYRQWMPDGARVTASGRIISHVSATYADALPGQLLALFGSSGRLEIAVRGGHARDAIGLQIGDSVTLTRRTSP